MMNFDKKFYVVCTSKCDIVYMKRSNVVKGGRRMQKPTSKKA